MSRLASLIISDIRVANCPALGQEAYSERLQRLPNDAFTLPASSTAYVTSAGYETSYFRCSDVHYCVYRNLT